MQHLKTQNMNEYEVREENTKKYLQKVKDMNLAFHRFSIQQISRKENIWVDTLSKLTASTLCDLYMQVFFKVVDEPNITLASQGF